MAWSAVQDTAPTRRAQLRLDAHTVVRGTSQTGRDLVSRLIRGFLARHFARHRYSNALIVMFLQYVLEYGSRLTLPKRASMIHPTRPPGNESWPTPNPTSTLFSRADGPILIQSIGQLYILIQLGPLIIKSHSYPDPN